MMLNTCILNIQGIASFVGNKAYYYGDGGAMLLQNTNSNINRTVYFNENSGSAIGSYSCNMTFIGTTYFYRNNARYGGAIMSSVSNIFKCSQE